MKGTRPTWKTFLVLALGAIYLLSPIDVIPDVIPLLGQTDDVVVTLVAWVVSYLLDRKET